MARLAALQCDRAGCEMTEGTVLGSDCAGGETGVVGNDNGAGPEGTTLGAAGVTGATGSGGTTGWVAHDGRSGVRSAGPMLDVWVPMMGYLRLTSILA